MNAPRDAMLIKNFQWHNHHRSRTVFA